MKIYMLPGLPVRLINLDKINEYFSKNFKKYIKIRYKVNNYFQMSNRSRKAIEVISDFPRHNIFTDFILLHFILLTVLRTFDYLY